MELTDKVIKDLVKRRHPEYEKKKEHWDFISATYAGGRAWFDDNVFRYFKEGDREIVEFELASAFDLMGVMLPNRQIVKNSCQWRYRSAECGYTGPYFDKNDAPTKLASADYCTKRLSSCRARINYFANGIIAFGGFPGANRA
ncbi:TPA: phage minor tail protein L [Enterobacter hormaechei]